MKEDKDTKRKLSKSEENKLIKEQKLFEAAYDLFTSKGINNTAISEIVKRAGVAKGTFYLYFKDKYDMMDSIVIRKSNKILLEVMDEVVKKGINGFQDSVIMFVDCVIEVLREDKKLLKLIHKNLSWGLFDNAFRNIKQYDEARKIISYFIKELEHEGISKNEGKKILFMIVELTSSIVYSSVILKEPDEIDNMKPLLYKTIRKMMQN